MIKLFSVEKPVELTEELQQQLTLKFILEGVDVWREKWIVKSLLEMSNNKCCFCECRLNEEAKYVQVEHFHNKERYKDEVLEWTNLLPICGRCNSIKNAHDTKVEPIIHPVKDNPKEHLCFYGHLLRGKTGLGDKTWRVLRLNSKDNYGDLSRVRFELIDFIAKRVDRLLELTIDYADGSKATTRRKNQIFNELSALLYESGPKYPYSATAATTLLNDPDYLKIKRLFHKTNLWDKDLADLEKSAQFCQLDRI